MGSPFHSEFAEKGTKAGPKLRTGGAKPGVSTTPWRMPPSPGKPRKIFKPLGKKVRVRFQGDV